MKDLNTLVTTVRSYNTQTKRYDYSFKFVFDSKETYLEFRSAWRKEYANLSTYIRDTKREIREEARARQCVAQAQSRLTSLRDEARRFMAMRMASKAEARRQYEEKKALAV